MLNEKSNVMIGNVLDSPGRTFEFITRLEKRISNEKDKTERERLTQLKLNLSVWLNENHHLWVKNPYLE